MNWVEWITVEGLVGAIVSSRFKFNSNNNTLRCFIEKTSSMLQNMSHIGLIIPTSMLQVMSHTGVKNGRNSAIQKNTK